MHLSCNACTESERPPVVLVAPPARPVAWKVRPKDSGLHSNDGEHADKDDDESCRLDLRLGREDVRPSQPAHRPGRPLRPGRGRQPEVRRGPRRPRPVRRAGEEPRAHPHLPHLEPVAVERRRRRVHRRRRWSRSCTATASSRSRPTCRPTSPRRCRRYGRVRLERIDETTLQLVCADRPLLEELARQKKVQEYLGEQLDDVSFAIDPAFRGVLKQALIAVGYPAEDLAGYTEGAALPTCAPRQWPRAACRSTSATTSATRPTSSTPAATSAAVAASSCCPAARARPSSASPPWRCCRRAR